MTPRSRSNFSAGTVSAALLGAMLVLVLAGCTTAKPTEQTGAPATSTASVSAAPITRMDPEQVQLLIADTFPVEVPVAAGEVISGKAQGENAWDYQLRVDAPIDVVLTWYKTEYERRSWKLVGMENVDGVAQITFRKSFAESMIAVQKSETGESSVVNGILGVGAPVLETQ